MGQHKTNPNSILKVQGKLEPKKKEKKLGVNEASLMVLLRNSWLKRLNK